MPLEVIIQRFEKFIIDPLILLLFALGFLYFLWGIVVFVWKADSDDGRETGRQHMIWGILGMFVMIAVYGIINLITRTFGL